MPKKQNTKQSRNTAHGHLLVSFTAFITRTSHKVISGDDIAKHINLTITSDK